LIYLSKIGIFHSYVGLPEGKTRDLQVVYCFNQRIFAADSQLHSTEQIFGCMLLPTLDETSLVPKVY
jgi:hypothetical protein